MSTETSPPTMGRSVGDDNLASTKNKNPTSKSTTGNGSQGGVGGNEFMGEEAVINGMVYNKEV